MNFYVYLICSKNNDNRLISYVGYTNNLKNRIKKHNSSKGATNMPLIPTKCSLAGVSGKLVAVFMQQGS